MRPTAGNAALRPAQNSSRSCSEVEICSVVEPQLARDLLHALDQFIDLDAGTIEFDDQQRFDIERIAGMDERLGGVDRVLVHHLHAAGNDPGADDIGDAFAGSLDLGKADHQRARGFRLLQNAHRDLGDDAEQAFRAGDDPHQVVAVGFRRLAADPQDLAGDQHEFAAEHVVGGHAVFQAVHAAGIFRDIAADRAGDLRRRIRRVIKSFVRDRLADGEIGDAGLDHGHAVVEIDLAHALELAEPQQHAVRERQRAARQRRAGPARHHLDAVVVAIFQNLRDLLGGVRQHHHHRRLAIGGQRIGLVGQHLGGARDHALARHDLAQRGDDFVAAVKHRLIGFRHHDGHQKTSGRRVRAAPRSF